MRLKYLDLVHSLSSLEELVEYPVSLLLPLPSIPLYPLLISLLTFYTLCKCYKSNIIIRYIKY
jgi:hypothetical protein